MYIHIMYKLFFVKKSKKGANTPFLHKLYRVMYEALSAHFHTIS